MKRPSIPRKDVRPVVAALFVLATAAAVADAAGTLHRIGPVTWHPKRYVGHELDLAGYPLARHPGYVIFSDEAHGRISAHDLPVTGKAIADLKLHRRYRIRGRFVDGGLEASNGNPYHLELTAAPVLAPH